MPTRRRFLASAPLAPLVAQPRTERSGAIVRAVVDAAGGGQFPTIQRAVDHVLDNPPRAVERVILEIRPGVYRERVKVPQDLPNVTFLGTDPEKTVITASVAAKDAGGTFFSPAIEVNGTGFEATGITFQNTFGTGSQAVALSLHSDRARFRNCRFLGWQDTLYTAWGRHYFTGCYIEGHVDFIFGRSAAVFEDCRIHSLGAGYLTAHSRTSAHDSSGFVFRRCKLTGEAGLLAPAPTGGAEVPFPAKNSGKGVFLGRPWRPYARVVFLDCEMGEHIRPEGWDNWGKAENEQTAFFAEAGSSGPGAKPAGRVKWAHALSAAEVAAFETARFLGGADQWNPAAF